jgi:two-component system sensor kinase FixL
LRDAVRAAAEPHGRTWEGRIANRSQQVQRIYFRANLERDRHGKPAVLRGVCCDVTSRHPAGTCAPDRQIDLLHAARLRTLGETVSATAHELGQPLSAAATFITSCDTLLRAGRPYDDTDLQARLARGLGAIDRASDIVRNLNRFLRRQGPARETFPVDTALREAVQMAAIGFERQERGRIIWDLEPILPPITGDRTQIEQVVVNLVRNAVEAMAEQPVRELAITARCLGSVVRVAVSDNGPGLPPMVEHDLFRPFVTTKPTGLGLGLSVCKTSIASHDGTITVRSTPNGTTFVIDLPATLDADCALVA